MTPEFTSSSALLQLVTAFNAGLLTSFTPCIYPLIPITLAIFGASNETSRLRSFLLALCYVLGIAVTYTVLGMISAKSGGLFGAALTKPAVVAILTLFLVALAFFSLDLFKFSAVSKLQNAASRVGGKGFRGAFLMGTVSGLVAAPCAGPLLVVILGVAAAQGNAVWGALLLFTYAIGMGMLFLCLGLFPSLLRSLPRSGNWLHAVKFLIGSLLFGVALFISQPFHAPLLGPILQPAALMLAPALIAIGLAYWAYRLPSAALKGAASILLAVSSFYYFIPPTSASPSAQSSHKEWATSIEEGLKIANARSTIVMADLYADWCAACIELDHKTFADTRVRARLEKLSLVRVDFTLDSDMTNKIAERYSVAGLPCLLFLGADGSEIPDSRVTGFLEPEKFLAHLDAVEAKIRN